VSEGAPLVARSYFEDALMHYPDHPSAIVGLSTILLDIYSEALVPPTSISGLTGSAHASTHTAYNDIQNSRSADFLRTPLGLGGDGAMSSAARLTDSVFPTVPDRKIEDLPPAHKTTSLPLVDRLAARDRAYGLLSGLTKLGVGWNKSDVWFALAKAHEQSGQPDKAKEALWWCVELEEGTGVRDWDCVGVGGYVL
jgi:hypothetical protein